MLRTSFLISVSAFALFAGSAQAQNYVRTENLAGPNVVIDFAALDQAAAAKNQWAVGPNTVTQQNLDDLPPPPKLQPPVAKQTLTMSPVIDPAAPSSQMPSTRNLPSTEHMKQAAIIPAQRPTILPTAPATTAPAAPSMAAPQPMPTSGSTMPPPTNFAARDMLDNAPPAPPVSPAATQTAAAPTPKNVTATISEPAKPDVTAKSMLASARSHSDTGGRVNLASISSGPPLPVRSSAPLAAAKPVAPVSSKPTPAAPIKPSAIVPPKPVIASDALDAPTPTTTKAPAPSLPPAHNLDSLLSDDATKSVASASANASSVKTKMPANALPVGVTDSKPTSLDNEDRPASAALRKTTPAKSAEMDTNIASAAPLKATPSTSHSNQVSVSFGKGDDGLNSAAKKDLDGIIATLQKDTSMRAQIRAYASGTAETSGQARRLSLSRALATRNYLLDKNIPATRLDIRALGNGQNAMGGMDESAAGASMDRVDISLVK